MLTRLRRITRSALLLLQALGSVRIQGGTITSRENVPFGGITGHRVGGVTPDGRHYRHYLALWPG